MKQIILSAVVAGTMLAGPALAADMPARMPVKAAPAAVIAAYNWSGFYTASSIGAALQDIDGVFNLPPPDVHNTSSTRAWTGSHVGYQWMLGSWVAGVEGSYYTPLSRKFDSSLTGPDCINILLTPNLSCEARISNLWTAGGKLGYAFGNWMVYGTGGYANGRIDQQLRGTVALFTTGETRERHGGWYAGAGFDVFVTRILWSDLILGVEYKHIELNDKLHVSPGGLPVNDVNLGATVDTIMAKATFKWVGAGPLGMLR